MEIKFFNDDIIGKRPKKVGDKFKADFLGCVGTFTVTFIGRGIIMAVLS